MKEIIRVAALLAFFVILFIGCNQPLTVSKVDLMEITKHWKEPKVAIWYFTGSDDEYHYFRFIDVDGTKDFRVKRQEMQIDATYPIRKNQENWRVMPWGPLSRKSEGYNNRVHIDSPKSGE